MEIGLSAEQELFVEVAATLSAEVLSRWQLGRGPDSVGSAEPPERSWRSVAEAGLLALRLDEALGGGGASCLDVCLLSEQLGRHAVPAPVLGTLLVLLPQDDVDVLVREFVEAAEASASVDNAAPVAQLLVEWQHTAEVHADPELYARLSAPTGDDYGPATPPEGDG